MVNTKTVFILGAGASMPYGLPSGAELRNSICKSAQFNSPMVTALTSECGVDPHHFMDFANAFLRASLPSIDAFLAKRPDCAEIGKLAIAYELCGREAPNRIFDVDNNDHWYGALWSAMERDLDSPTLLRHNHIRFVTFNYDRSLEYFLHEATKHTFKLSDEAALEACQEIPILHVYGSLGGFHFEQSESTRPYMETSDGTALRQAAAALRVIPEARHDDKDFETARSWFDWAERICFLGFGFDALNMERLGLADVLLWKKKNALPAPGLVASMFGKTDREIGTITGSHFSSAPTHRTEKERNLMTLRNTGVLD